MTAQCPSCGSAQPDGLLCHDDTSAFETMLAAVPQLIEQLDLAVSKQARIGTGGGKGGLAREKSPVNFGAMAVRDLLIAEVAIWGTDIDELRRAPWAAKAVAGLGRAVKNAYRVIDRMQERTYLGTCLYEEDGATCHAELWAREGASQVTCSQCEVTHPVAERRDWLMARAAPMVVTAKEAAVYIGEVGTLVVSETSIRNWVGRGKIPLRPGLSTQRQFELGDLLDYIGRTQAHAATASVADVPMAV